MSSFKDLVKRVNAEKKAGVTYNQHQSKEKEEEDKNHSSFKDLVRNVNNGSRGSVLNSDQVNDWFGGVSRTAQNAYNYLSKDGYKTPDTSYLDEIDSHLSKANLVGQFIRANKNSFDNYEETYQNYVNTVNYLRDLQSGVKSANDYYSQWKTEDDYIKGATETSGDRQKRYEDNLKKIEELKAKRSQAAGTSVYNPDSNFMMPVFNPKVKQLDDEIKALEAENLKYERGEDGYVSKAVDDHSKVTQNSDFAADSANRNYKNPNREEIELADAMNDSSTWRFDADGVYRDAFGNELAVDETNTWYNPASKQTQVEDKLALYLNTSEDERVAGAMDADGTRDGMWSSVMTEGFNGAWEYLTEKEKDIYYYYLYESQEKADKYLADMEVELNRRRTLDRNGQWRDAYDESNLLMKIAMNIATVPAKFASTVTGTIDNAVNTLTGNDINPYSMAHGGMHFSQTIRGSTAEDLDATGIKIPVLDFSLGDLYQTGMSRLDSALATAIFGGGGTVFLGMGAAQEEAYRLYQQGASAEQITLGAFSAGAAEAVFEYLSFDKLVKMENPDTIWKLVKSALIQGGIEASEETFTEISNIITNAVIMGQQSDLAKLYEENGNDWSKTGLSLVKQVANAAFGGFIGGFGAGVTQGGNGYINNQAQYNDDGKTIMGADGGVDALKNLANEVAGVSDAKIKNSLNKQAGKVSSEIATGKGLGKIGASMKNTSNATKVGRLYNTVQTANNLANTSANKADIAKSLERKGFTTETANDIADVLVASYNGQELTKAQEKLLKSAKENSVVQDAISNIVTNEQSTMGQRSQSIRDFQGDVQAGLFSRATGVKLDVAKEVMKGNRDAVKESFAESHYEVSTDGKTIDKEGNIVNVVGIESVKDGKLILKTENGTIDASEVSFATQDEAFVYSAISNMDVSAESAWALVKGFNKADGVSAQVYAIDIPLAYKYGKLNYKAGLQNLSLTPSQSATAFQMGRSDAAVETTEQASAEATLTDKNADKKIIFEGFTYNEKTAKTNQKASMAAIDMISKMSNLEVHVYKSYKKKDGNLYAVVNGKERLAPNGYFTDGNKVYIDINAGNKGEGLMLYTLSHEIGHYIAKWNAQDFKAISDFLFEHYGNNVPINRLLETQKNKLKNSYKKDGKPIPSDSVLEKEAQEELVCDMLSRMLADKNAYDKLMELKQNDLNTFQKLGQAIKNALTKIAKAIGVYDTQNPDFMYAASVENFGEEAFRQLQDLYIKAFVQADANYQAEAAQKNTTEDGGVKHQARNTESFTLAETQAIQNIGRKSIYAFTSADIKATERLAMRYWKEMGNKSPFFRAWFGDWRVNDQSQVQTANIRGDSRGVQKNEDTEWDIQVSGQVFNETKKHTDSYNVAARPYLPYINDIVRKAILLDTWGFDQTEVKSENSLLMHSLYAVADIGNGPEVLKLYVEEMNDPNKANTSKRSYQLQNIEKYRPAGKSSQKTAISISPAAGNINTVADLFAYVKQLDKNFNPKEPSKIVDTEGKPKVMHHGSTAQFEVFDRTKAKSSGMYGKGFYFTDSSSHAGTYGNLYNVYLNIRNPLQYGGGNIKRSQVFKFLKEVAENEDYSIENYGTYDVDEVLKIVMGQKKTVDAFQIIQDISTTAIGDMVEAVEVFNRVSGTSYDGIVVPTETVAFYSTQIKSATDNVGTFDGNEPNIKHSDRDYSYEALTSKPDMVVTTVDGNVPNNRADVVAQAKQNAAKVGKFDPKTGSVSVYVDDVGADVVLATNGLKHSLDRRFAVNAPVLLKAGEILQKSIRINEMTPKKADASESYILIGAARNESGEMYIVRSVINRFSNELASMDVLYAINAKKEPVALLPRLAENSAIRTDSKGNQPRSMRQGFQGPVTDSTISIADLLDLVNQYFSDILPEDVLKHYGYDARPDGDLGADVLYQDRADESVSNRSLLANALESAVKDDTEKQKLREYREQIEHLDAEEQKLRELNGQIKELSFAKGKRDTKKISALRDEATKTANRINTYDKQLLRLEASKPLQDVLAREKKRAYQRAEQKGKEALDKYKERAAKTQRELLDRWQESRKKGIDSRHRTAMRHKIKDVVNELNQYLLKGTKDRHVPESLQKAVAEALNAVNMDTVGAEERIAKLKAEMMKAKTPEQIQEISRKIDNISEMGDRMNGRLKKLKDAYDDLLKSPDENTRSAYDEVIHNKLDSVIDKIGNTPLRDMTLAQLEDVYDMYRMVLKAIRDVNKSFKDAKNQSISTRANAVMAEVEKVGGKHKLSAKILNGIKKFGWNNLKPVYAFEHIGSSTLTEAFKNVRAGEDTWALDITEARKYYLEKSKKYQYDSWDFQKQYQFQSTSGMEFSLNLEQILSLYAYSKRYQAADHLKYGGIVFDESTRIIKKTKLGISLEFNPTEATAYNISEETLAEITSKLTAEQKDFADEMQNYLSTVMGAKGNEVSMQMYDIKLFKDKNYFPLKSAQQFMEKAREQQKGDVKIKNAGFSKETVPKAKNPIVLTPFMEVWSNHVNEMSMYHAFVLPLEDFYRIYNYKTPSKDETLATEGVNQYIQDAYGREATAYIDQLLKDLNGGARTDSTTGFINKMMGLFKKGSVFASMSVVVQQPSAIARAAALVDTKYFIGPKVDHKRHKALWDEVKKYAPVAIIKEMGYFDTNMGKSTQDFILGKEYSGFKDKMKALITDSNYRDEVLSKAPALADELAWCGIWEAVKRETKANNPGMDVKSEAFLKIAGERFTDVIVKTQVYDSVLARSGMMRSKDTGMKMATAFMAEPTTSINMIADALLQGKRGNKKYARTAIGAVIASQILNSILVSFVYAGRDDDEEETYLEKYIGTLAGEVFDSLNPATYIPFIKDIVSIVKGYDVERSDMAVISDLWKAWENLSKDSFSPYRKVEGFAGSIAQIFGLPVKNIMRDARGIYQTVDSFLNGQQTTGAGIGYAVKSALPEWIGGGDVSKQQQLYDAIISGDKNHADRLKGSYKTEDAYHSAVRKALRENDPRIKEATVAGFNGDPSERVRIANLIIADGFDQDDVVAAINSEVNEMEPEEPKGDPKKKKGFYTADDFATEIANGDQSSANAAKADIIQTAVKNGKTQKEAEEAFASSAKTAFRKMFVAGTLNESKAAEMLKTYCRKKDGPMDDNDVHWTIKEWEYEKSTGSSDGYGKYNDFHAAVQTGKNLKAVIKEYTDHGIEKKTLASQITSYFKPLYKEMSKTERAGIKGYLLNAYALLGYNRNEKAKDIDAWLKD